MRSPPARRVAVLWMSVALGCGSAAPIETSASTTVQRLPIATPAILPDPTQGPPALVCQRAPAEPAARWHELAAHRKDTSPDTCSIADSNLARVEDAILATPLPAHTTPTAAWDHKSPLAGLSRLAQRFGLDREDNRRLTRNGFVAAARLAQPSYGWAFHEIHQSELPLYVSVDSIFNAVYASHDHVVKQLEHDELEPRLAALLSTLHCQLPGSAPRLPAETARDLDVYFVVARNLLIGDAAAPHVTSALGDPTVDREAEELVELATRAQEMQTVTLFGRERVIDFTQFRPRGHYVIDQQPYFRAFMWLARLELNLVSRSSRSSAPGDAPDPRETPREDVLALGLAELVTASGMTGELERIEHALAVLAGRREDIPVTTIAELAKRAGITDPRAGDAAQRLRAVIGDGFRRTARIHPMPEGSTELPAITTLLGPRIVPDTVALRLLMHSETPMRMQVHSADMAYLLGHDRALTYLRADLETYPELRGNLDEARRRMASAPRTGDLYTAWLDAIRALAHPVDGALPSFTRTEAYADLRYNTTVAAYAQLRHNHVLIAGQAYGEGGCKIPDSYLEAVPEVYDALARFAELGARELEPLSPAGHSRAYFLRLGKLARVFAQIARLELSGDRLPDVAQQFLRMVSEILPYGSDGLPTYTGWYFDLFADRNDAIASAALVADYATSPTGVGHVGTQSPVLAIFAVDTGGGPRAMIGPVARAYEHWSRGPRLDDTAALELPAAERLAPWTASYLVPAPPRPAFRLVLDGSDAGDPIFEIKAKRALGAMTIEAFDHNRIPVHKVTRAIVAGTTRLLVRRPDDEHLPVFHFQLGRWHGWAELRCMDGCYLRWLDEVSAAAAAAADPPRK